MSPVLKYGLACAALVGFGVLIAALVLDRAGLLGVVAAAAVALPVQVALFAGMKRATLGTNAFLGAWVGGMLARMALVGVVALALYRWRGLPEAPTLIGLVAFFFGMVLLEAPFLGLGKVRGASELRRE